MKCRQYIWWTISGNETLIFFFRGRKREIVLGGGTRLTSRLIWQLLRALPLGGRGIELAADMRKKRMKIEMRRKIGRLEKSGGGKAKKKRKKS